MNDTNLTTANIELDDSFSGEMLFRTKLGPQNIDAIVQAAISGLLYDVTPGDLNDRVALLQERINEFDSQEQLRLILTGSEDEYQREEGARMPDRSAHLARMRGELPLLVNLQERLASV